MATTIPTGAKKIVTTNKNTYFTANNITIGTAIPTTGTYVKGDIIINSSPTADAIGWICTTSGKPGSWKVIQSGVDVTSLTWQQITGKPSTFPPTIGTKATEAFAGDKGKTAYDHSQVAHAPAEAQKNSDITKGEIEAKLIGDITSHNHNSQYYTETEMDTLLGNKADIEHSHTFASITGKPSTFPPTIGTKATEAFAGDKGNIAYEHSQVAHAPAEAQKNSDITKGEIEAKLTGTITSHNHNSQYYTKDEITNDVLSSYDADISSLEAKLPVTFYKDDNGDIWFA